MISPNQTYLQIIDQWVNMYLQSYRLLLIIPFSRYVSTSSVVSVHILPDKPMAKKPTEVIEENCEFTADCSFDHMRKENIRCRKLRHRENLI